MVFGREDINCQTLRGGITNIRYFECSLLLSYLHLKASVAFKGLSNKFLNPEKIASNDNSSLPEVMNPILK